MLAFPFCALVFTSAENMLLLPGLQVCRSAWQQSLVKVLLLRETEVIKTAEKDSSATIVTSVCLADVTVVGSINTTEFWQRQTQPPSFLLLLSRKMDLAK